MRTPYELQVWGKCPCVASSKFYKNEHCYLGYVLINLQSEVSGINNVKTFEIF